MNVVATLTHAQYSVLVTCIFLNKTRAEQAERHLRAFLRRYPTAESVREAEPEDIRDTYFAKLGLFRRAWWIVKLANQLISDPPQPYAYRKKSGKDAGYACEVAHLAGVGVYGSDAWRLFCKERFYANHGFTVSNEWKRVKTTDKALQTYIYRRRRQEMADQAANEITSRLSGLRLSKGKSADKKGTWIGNGEYTMFVPQKFIEKAKGCTAMSYEGELKLKCSPRQAAIHRIEPRNDAGCYLT